jgi:hypothetical protein
MAFPGTYNFNYYRGDTHQFVLSPKNSDGTVFQLDSYAPGGVNSAIYTIATARGSVGIKTSAQAVINTTIQLFAQFFQQLAELCLQAHMSMMSRLTLVLQTLLHYLLELLQ